MVITAFFMLFGTLFGRACQAVEQPDTALFRDLIVILDDRVETNPSKIDAAIFDLQNALQAEIAPILVNATLWKTFIEARQEWILQAQILGTIEYKTTALRNAINERIQYWYGVLQGSFDDVHMRSLIGDKINEEFYLKERYEQLKESGIIPKDIDVTSRMRHCVTIPYDFDVWCWFYLDTGYYLAIPKKYCARYTDSTNSVDILKASGFNPSLAKHMVDPLVISHTLVNIPLSIDQTIIPTMQKLLQLKGFGSKDYTWSICMRGHGSWYATAQGYVQQIVGITVTRFRELCIWFETNVSMHILYLDSCNAGGINREIFSNVHSMYTYPIIVENLSDMVANNERHSFDYLPNGRFHLRGYHLKKNDLTNRWEISYDVDQRFQKFFEKLHELPTILDPSNITTVQQKVFEVFMASNKSAYLQNTPQLLLPQSTTWLLCYPATAQYLNVQSSVLAEVCNTPHMLRQESILVDAPVFTTDFQIADSKVHHILAISPGYTTHCVKGLQASMFDVGQMLALFWPPMSVSAIKQLLFDAITCVCNPQDPLIQLMGISEKSITFKNVIFRIVKNERIDILFTAPNGDAYSASMRAIDGKPMVRNLQKLSAEVAESYYAHYAATKEELINKTNELYAPLRTRYAQALSAAAQDAQAA